MKTSENVVFKKLDDCASDDERMEYFKLRETVSEDYFHGVKGKNIVYTEFITPMGNRVCAWINRKPNHQLGSMVITSVNGVSTRQYVQGMPKLEYAKEYLSDLEDEARTVKHLDLYDKLDGTNICIYKLYYPNTGGVLEFVPKTRNMPVLSEDFQKLFNRISDFTLSQIYTLFAYLKGCESVCCELYGKDNQHLINYTNLDEDLKLSVLSAYDMNGRLLDSNKLYSFCNLFGLEHPRWLGEYRTDDFSIFGENSSFL